MNNNLTDAESLPFLNFLQGIIYEPAYDQSHMMLAAEGMAVLDFCNNQNIELNDIDFSMIDQWTLVDGGAAGAGAPNSAAPAASETQLAGLSHEPAPVGEGGDHVDLSELQETLAKVWTTSWTWRPENQCGYGEQSNIAVTSGDIQSVQFQESQGRLDRIVSQKLDSSLRDRVLIIVLQTCATKAMAARVATSFPSADVLDSLVNIFLAAHMCSVSSWIHMPLLTMDTQWPDWIAVAAAAGGILTSVPTLRKFGLALQEAVRECF